MSFCNRCGKTIIDSPGQRDFIHTCTLSEFEMELIEGAERVSKKPIS